MMLTPRLRVALASVSCLMLVVPEGEATDLPFSSLIEPVSLICFSVPVSSSALACPAQKAAASARPIIRRRFIRALPHLDDFGNACIIRAGIECNFRPPYDPQGLMQ